MRLPAVVASLAVTLASLAGAVPLSVASADTPAPPDAQASAGDVYIVEVRSSPSPVGQDWILGSAAGTVQQAGGRVESEMTAALDGMVVTMPSAEAAAALAGNPNVLSVTKDQRISIDGSQSSPPWGLDRIDQATLPLDGAYKYANSGAGVRVYIADTGLNAGHDEFAGRVAAGQDWIGDGLGTDDCHGHGTHVAGTAAGATYGVAKQATVVPLRVLGCDGTGSLSDLILALDWVVANNPADVRAVVNASIGGSGVYAALDSAISTTVAAGIPVVVSAGNDNADACLTSPARAADAITVAATTSTDARAAYSNWGSCVDVFAPGSGILSAYIGGPTATQTLNGTSMASPHVAGLVAQYLQRYPTETSAQIRARLLTNGTAGVVTDLQGSPDLMARSIYGIGDPPTSVSGTAGDTQATVTWTAPAFDGGGFQGYAVYSTTNGGASWTTVIADTGSDSTSYAVTGLTNGQGYQFAVATVNASGTSVKSALSGVVTPASSAPVADTADVIAGSSVLIDVLANDPAGATIASVTAPATGSASIEAGKIRYTAPGGSSGTASFQYAIAGNATKATVTVTIHAATAAPVADTATVIAGSSVLIDVLANDPAGADLSAVSSAPATGTAAIEAGKIRYTAPAGTAPGDITFAYRLAGNATPATVTVTIHGPSPVADTATVTAGSSVLIDVLANDPAGAAITSVTAPGTGTAAVEAGKIRYAAPSGSSGTTSFQYAISGTPTKATVTVTITAPPAAQQPSVQEPAAQQPAAQQPSAPAASSTPASTPASPAPTAPTTGPTSPPATPDTAPIGRAPAGARPPATPAAGSTTARGAPVLQVDAGEPVRLRVNAAPGSRAVVQARIDGAWVTVASGRARRSGTVTTSAFAADAGTYLVRVATTGPGGKPAYRYVRITAS